ncbi:MAG: tripartite tricarboxylate transporter permease [Thermodesulfobacteriota bacterium]
MGDLQNLMMGFSIALSLQNLLFAFIGCMMGTVIGVLPGVGPAAGTALLIPLTFHLPATGAIIMLAAIYYGAMYGGTITSVLMNVPGEASSVVVCLDGHQMALKGRAGVALSIAAIGSFIGGTVATLGLCVAAPPLARMALNFGPPEFFALMALGLSLLMGLAGKSIVKALMMGVVGLILGLVGMDPVRGMPRFTFGQAELLDGLEFVSVIMGFFGVSDILLTVETEVRQTVGAKVSSLMPTRQDVRDSAWPITRGTLLGFFLGLIPGMTGSISSFMSYAMEKKMSKYPDKFGTGMIEGVAGPETANNSHANAALIPLFTMGIPGSPTIAVLMGAFIMNGLVPGPLLFKDHPDLVWAVIASLYIGNVMLLILNLPLIGMWVKVLKIPYSILFAIILAFTLVGSYSVNGSAFDLKTLTLFGLLGYLFKKLDFPLAPVALTFILGPMMELALRQSLIMSQGHMTIFVSRPISCGLLILAVIILLSSALRTLPFGTEAVRGEDSQI